LALSNGYNNQAFITAKALKLVKNLETIYRDSQKDISSFLPPSDSKRFLKELVSQSLSNNDCDNILGILVEYMSKEDRNIKLDENIETSILSFYIDKV
jgi:type III secretory pathway component EscV